jgi:predicted NAD-dependent protein-ADP-ribosyltransferase YbiA (DUF1768 family)
MTTGEGAVFLPATPQARPGAEPTGAAPPTATHPLVAGQTVTPAPGAAAAAAAARTDRPAHDALSPEAGGAPAQGPHIAQLPQISEASIHKGFEAVKAKAGSAKYQDPGKLTPLETLAQDYVEDAIAEMCGRPPHYPYMIVNVKGQEYTVEQRGNRMRVTGPGADQQDVMSGVLNQVQGENTRTPPIFDPQELTSFITYAQSQANIHAITPEDRGQAERIAFQALSQSGFIGGVGSVFKDSEHVKKLLQNLRTRMKTTRAAAPTVSPSSPGAPQQTPIVPDDVRSALAKIIHNIYQKIPPKPAASGAQGKRGAATPARVRPIDTSVIRDIASSGPIRFYKADTTPDTECFGNYHVLERGRRVHGCITSEGAFLSRKYGFEPNDLTNPFKDATEHTNPSLAKLNKALEASKGAIPGWTDQRLNILAMSWVLREKFDRDSERAALLATGNALLVEETPEKGRDVFWATDPDGTGKNMLGQLLMELRGQIGGPPYTPDFTRNKWK